MGTHQSSNLRPEVLADIQQETGFTPTEIRDLYRQFQSDSNRTEASGSPMTKSKSGKGHHMRMGLEEFKQIYLDIFPDGNADGFAEQVFRTFDKDGTGKLDFNEFITTLSIQLKGSKEEKLNWAFDLYDIDQTGVIKREEALTIVSAIFQLGASGVASPSQDESGGDLCPATVVDHLFKRADKDRTDRISRKEFIEGAAESRTISALFEGAAEAAALPYMKRKDSSGTYGRSRTGSLLKEDEDDRSRAGTM